jgi:hypothetical protein
MKLNWRIFWSPRIIAIEKLSGFDELFGIELRAEMLRRVAVSSQLSAKRL